MADPCVICLDLLAGDAPTITLGCKHVFHATCYLEDETKRAAHSCPICRVNHTSSSCVFLFWHFSFAL